MLRCKFGKPLLFFTGECHSNYQFQSKENKVHQFKVLKKVQPKQASNIIQIRNWIQISALMGKISRTLNVHDAIKTRIDRHITKHRTLIYS